MQKKYSPLLLVLFVVLFSSCRTFRHIYSPAPANNPAFRQKGESQLAVMYSGSDGNNGIGNIQKNEGGDILAAYAVTDHLALTGSYYFRKEQDTYGNNYYTDVFDSSVVNYKRKMADIGIGYFTLLGDQKKVTFSIYGGYGFGNFQINDHGLDDTLAAYSRSFEARVHKWYVQPGFNFWFSDHFSLGLTARYSLINFADISTSYTQREREYFMLDKIKNKKPFLIEPTLSIQFGIPAISWLKIYASTTALVGWPRDYPSTRAINGSVGLVADLFNTTGRSKNDPVK